MTTTRRGAIAGIGAASLLGLPTTALAQLAGSNQLGVVPLPRVRSPSGSRRWVLSDGAKIVADDACRREAKTLAEDLVAFGLARREPRIAGRNAEADDIVLSVPPGRAAEAYRLSLGERGPLHMSAPTSAGIFYAGRTLLQLLMANGHVPALTIDDAPTLPERGVTVDVGRKFYSMAWLRRLIRRMGWWKLNTLHLHLSDNEGFGYASRRHPAFASPEHLTLDDLRDLVAYAARHHITVVPELDSPGHLASVLKHRPELMLRASSGAASGRAINVANPAARGLIADLIDELLPIFPGDRWHLGGDEVLHTEQPKAHPAELNGLYPQLVDYARGRAGAGANALDAITLYLNDLDTRLRARGKRCRGWNDGLQAQGIVPVNRTIDVDYWENLGQRVKTAAQHLAEGHRVLNTHSRYLYYVIAEPPFPWYPRPTAQRIYDEWSVAQFEGQPALPAPVPGLIGAHFSIWADRPQALSEAQIADGIAAPLAALAQKCWGGAPRPMPYPAFAQAVGELRSPLL